MKDAINPGLHTVVKSTALKCSKMLFGTYLQSLYDKVWYMSFCATSLVHCHYTMSSYYIDLPCMARLSCSYCIDLPFYGTLDGFVSKPHSQILPLSRSSPCDCTGDLRAARFNHIACKPETT